MKNKDFKDLLKSIDQMRELARTCPNCHRKMPSIKHRRRFGCKWCVPIKNTKYCNGKY
jgi:protein-arginine kinase activator protein McsA